ncbi:UROD/MetE-like protein [Saitoella complicata NRRL Y-17804]|uniref:Cobalamin-independent methionine synthase MetE C-terminal/archaeal domain-containing protein n=1 Tax=Saitoella complicata (strain BCRC 22490 / CBS 7301 / JCM 7358 / NBRC 10748 / NRRL Y-17804) TaxID=698492 RepID=A0A0E9NIM9_SAICN|nr:UROD/MetE-like protein [Saitoella complicata NRRL Y-17804]ODQ52148.1 UROD/MetE-like protein [Saitoella complicata NRRL Y-17804]GAO49531.1 hypothetical protein G7K_3680-t1 [Saitoella complicata NRRL Y-17804]
MPAYKINAPFRAEQVGSLLRPKELLEARAKKAAGEITPEELRAVEDKWIAQAAKEQCECGLKSVTDGEFRRAYFHLDFLEHLEGVRVAHHNLKSDNKADYKPPTLEVVGKIRHVKDIQVDDYKFLAPHVKAPFVAKAAIPSPTMLHFRGGRQAISEEAYPNLDDFFTDLAKAYQVEIKNLYDAGCRYLQLDDTNLAYLCDPKMREAAAQRGEDVDALPRNYAKLINASLEGVPEDMVVGVHLCRGNFRSNFFASGGYEPVAKVLFQELNVDTYFLEWDDERSGDFAPLRFLPPNKTVVLGLVSSKHANMETKESLKARIAEAAKYAPLEQLCLSPQCGFSSTAEGNEVTPADQWAKLKLCIEVAEEVWSDA